MRGLFLRNAEPARLADVPQLSLDDFRDTILSSVAAEKRVISFFAHDAQLFVVLADDVNGRLAVACTRVSGSFPSLTPECPQLHLFEREIREQSGIVPDGHPWLKPVRNPDATTFFRVDGDEVHEVAVGPVHAGVIEPGHFRFQCHGERVFHLEIALGYQHRGIERALIGGPHKRTMLQVEAIAGDTTIGHALAYAQALETLGGATPPARAHALRGIALELERLANHVGDLGALSGDVAYLPSASYCGRLRGDFLNLTAALCGSRFGRGLVRPGGVLFDVDDPNALLATLDSAARDVADAVGLLWTTPTVTERFENTGAVSAEECDEIGMVGVAARACGRAIDVRHDFPFGVYRFAHVPVMTAHYGDVNSRALVRWLELQQSIEFVRDQLRALPSTPIRVDVPPLAADSLVVSMTEGWRGEICHVAITGGDGNFARYKIVDPSFHNWFGLALALRNGEISDFPLCNKSFNLSYCGHDL